MSKGWMLIAAVTLGCAAVTPSISRPAACVCSTQNPCCKPRGAKPAVASVSAATSSASEQTAAPNIESALLKYKIAVHALAASTTTCARLRVVIGAACLELEPAMLRAIHEARAAVIADDATPIAERKLVSQSAYDTARDKFRAELELRLHDAVFDDVTSPETIGPVYDHALTESYVLSGMPLEGPKPLGVEYANPTSQYVIEFRAIAERHLAFVVEPTVQRCVDGAIDERRGKWVAILNGKL